MHAIQIQFDAWQVVARDVELADTYQQRALLGQRHWRRTAAQRKSKEQQHSPTHGVLVHGG